MSEIWNILGGDVSWWQGPWEWDIARKQGWRFAFIRAGSCTASQGTCYTDHQFENNSRYAPEEMPVGYYWYFRPQHNPIAQADYFCDLVRDKKRKLPLVIDIETTGGLSPAQVTAAVVKFISHVYAELQVWCTIYSRSFFMRDEMVYHVLFDECEIWIARYTSKKLPYGNPNETPKFIPPWGKHTTVWQYVANSNAAEIYGGHGPPNGEDDVDLNFFHGTEDEFRKWSGATPPVTQDEYIITLYDNNQMKIGEGWINKDYVNIKEE